MSEQDLDRLIDAATTDMIEHEPSPALRHEVMARVRDAQPAGPRRFVWATTGLVAAVCIVIALAMMERTPTPSVQNSPPARTTTVELPSAPVGQPAPALEPASQTAVPVAWRRAPLRLPPDDPSPIEAITTEPLVLPSIDLTPIEYQSAAVEGLEIEELTIEPLTASND